MILLLCVLVAAVVFCAGIFMAVNREEWYSVLYGVLGIVIAGFILAKGIDYIGNKCLYRYPEKIELYSEYNDSEIGGTFLLGSGSIDQVDRVYFWTKRGNILRKNNVLMDKSVFIEDGETYMNTYYLKTVDTFWCKPNFYENQVAGYEFHVPEGSVTNMYQFR